MAGLLGEIGGTLSAYLRGQVRIAVILSAIYAAGFLLLGVPGWLLLAPICGFLIFVPVLGSLIAIALPAFVLWTVSSDWMRILGVLLFCVVMQGVEGFYLTPKILGKRLQLSPLAIFVAVLAGSALFGFIGLLLAVPVLAVGAVLWKYARR